MYTSIRLFLFVTLLAFYLSTPVQAAQVSAIYSGAWHNCAVFDDNSIKCWGMGFYGSLGYEDYNDIGNEPDQMGKDLPTVNLGMGRSVKSLAAGEITCAILDNDSVKCWGEGGLLGDGDIANRGDDPGEMGDNLPMVDLGTGRTAKMIATKVYHSCAILDDDSVKCWGRGTYGQLGYGDNVNRGDDPGEMGDNLPTVDLGTGRTAKMITVGFAHTCAILDNDSVKCWGKGRSLGYGDNVSRGDDPGEMGDNLFSVNLGLGKTAKTISAGYNHTCAVLNDDSVKCWGSGYKGALGYGDTLTRGDEPYEMGDDLPPVDLGTGKTVVMVKAGFSHNCAILDDYALKCWGRSSGYGELGYGDSENRGDEFGEMGDNLPTVDLGTGKSALMITTGEFHTCAFLSNNAVKCWGMGSMGTLGYGDGEDRGWGPDQMGNNLPVVDL